MRPNDICQETHGVGRSLLWSVEVIVAGLADNHAIRINCFSNCTIVGGPTSDTRWKNAMILDGSVIPGIGMPRAFSGGMNVLLSTDGDRISPVLDAAKSFLLVSARSDGAQSRRQVYIAEADPIAKAKRIVELRANVLICGAISWPLEAMLTSSDMRVIPNTCGPLDEVLAAHFSGALTAQAFLMPGCPGRQHRHRHRHGRGWRNGW